MEYGGRYSESMNLWGNVSCTRATSLSAGADNRKHWDEIRQNILVGVEYAKANKGRGFISN